MYVGVCKCVYGGMHSVCLLMRVYIFFVAPLVCKIVGSTVINNIVKPTRLGGVLTNKFGLESLSKFQIHTIQRTHHTHP